MREPEKLNHLMSESIEKILSLVREYGAEVLSHLHKFGSEYVGNNWNQDGKKVKGNGTEYSDVFQNHFTKNADSPLANLFHGFGENEYNQKEYSDKIRPNTMILAKLHWYDFLVITSKSNINHLNVKSWGVDNAMVYQYELEVIHLILLAHSNSETIQSWADVYEYANFSLLNDWKKFLSANKSILDSDTQLVEKMILCEFSNTGGRRNQLYSKSPFRRATLGDYWDQVFESPKRFNDFFKQRPEDARINLSKQVRRLGYPPEYSDLGVQESIPVEILDAVIWGNFNNCFIFEKKHEHPVIENFIKNTNWKFESKFNS